MVKVGVQVPKDGMVRVRVNGQSATYLKRNTSFQLQPGQTVELAIVGSEDEGSRDNQTNSKDQQTKLQERLSRPAEKV